MSVRPLRRSDLPYQVYFSIDLKVFTVVQCEDDKIVWTSAQCWVIREPAERYRDDLEELRLQQKKAIQRNDADDGHTQVTQQGRAHR